MIGRGEGLNRRRLSGRAAAWLAWVTLAGFGLARAQDDTQQTATVNVAGRVVNALTGAPVPRALVRLNSRAVLTDALGRFTFPQFGTTAADNRLSQNLQAVLGSLPGNASGPQAWVQVTKPGYSQTLDATELMSQQPVASLSSPLELKLYPDALLTGTVTGSDRQPLSRVALTLYRQTNNDIGVQVQPVAFTTTDSHGEYRFQQPPGRYRILLRYSPRADEEGDAVLPRSYPESAAGGSSMVALGPGEERRVDLRGRTGAAYPISFQVEDSDEHTQNPRITVKPGSGDSFTVFARPTRTPGELQIALPNGSYELHASEFIRGTRLEAWSRVNVAGKPVSGLTLHFAEAPAIPVELSQDPVATSGTSSTGGTQAASSQGLNPMNFNLRLENLEGNGEDGMGEVRATRKPDGTFQMAPESGTYRLLAQSSGDWYVESASYGTANLLSEPLVAGTGAGGEPIRLLVSNGMGQVSGTVQTNGAMLQGYVYLLPHEPSLTPFYVARFNTSGSYQLRVPPGSYTAVAVEHRFTGDLRDPRVRAQVSAGGAAAQVAPGGKATLDLELNAGDTAQ